MAKYRFKRGEETKDFEIPFADYDAQKKTLESEGWVRVLVPVAVKDSGSGRD